MSGFPGSYVSSTASQVGMFGSTGTVRIPWAAQPGVLGPAAVASGTSNVACVSFDPSLKGDFTGIGGSDPGQAWGLDLFATVGDGTAANDVKGLTNITGGELELDVLNTTGTINVARGGMAGVFLFGAAAGATITQAEGFRASAPDRVAGATGGAITNAYSLFVEAPTIGSASNFSLFCAAGAPARFGGTVQFGADLEFGPLGYADLRAGYTTTDGARLVLDSNTGGLYGSGNMILDLNKAGSSFAMRDSANALATVHQFGKDGSVALGAAGSFGSGAGPMVFLANSTTAPTTNPTGGGILYVSAGALKYRGTSGTVTTIAAA